MSKHRVSLVFSDDGMAHCHRLYDDGVAPIPMCGSETVKPKSLEVPAQSTVSVAICPVCVEKAASALGLTTREFSEQVSAGKIRAR